MSPDSDRLPPVWPPEPPAPVSDLPDDAFAQLRADLPIMLLPIRLETRLSLKLDAHGNPTVPILKLRMYPDQIHVDSHEAALSNDERDAGQRYWTTVSEHRGDDDLLRAAWLQLTGRWGERRAAWIARVMESHNGTSPTPVLATATGPPVARALPTTWYVSGHMSPVIGKGHEIVIGEVINTGHAPRPLPFGVDPSADPPVPGEDSPTPPSLRWTVDFEEAVQCRMAADIELPLPSDVPFTDADVGLPWRLDRLVVFGLDLESDPTQCAETVADLLESHYATDGLAFVAPGTPTNNTETARAGLAPATRMERADQVIVTPDDIVPAHANACRLDSNAVRLSRALGLRLDSSPLLAATRGDEPPPRPAALARAPGGMDGEEATARAMNTALWPVSWGAYLFSLLRPRMDEGLADWIRSGGAIDWGRQHFQDAVRALGPLPTLRVGDQPYGVLPAVSLSGWDPSVDAAGARLAVQLHVLLRQVWLPATNRVPTFSRHGDQVDTFLAVFSLSPYTVAYQARHLLGRELIDHLGRLFDDPHWQGHTVTRNAALELITASGPGWLPPLAFMTYLDEAHPVTLPLVTPDPAADPHPLHDYAQTLIKNLPPAAGSAWQDIRQPTDKATLLHRLLRHSVLTALAHAAFRTGNPSAKLATDPYDVRAFGYESELPGIPLGPSGEAPTIWSLLDQVGENLYQQPPPELSDLTSALCTLKDVPAAVLERHLIGTLDLASHRIDAWITSLGWRRLESLRRQPASARGLHLGAYGWVENLTLMLGGPASAYGYHHAPSLPQAVTAAVLQSAHLTAIARGQRSKWADSDEQVDIDLGSSRARQAVWLLDALRGGQSLPTALGYRFERWLQDKIAEGTIPGRLLGVIREHYHVQGMILHPDGSTSGPTTATTLVTDGLKLHDASCRTCGGDPAAGLGFLTAVDRDAVLLLVAQLHELVDSLSDALMAESVHHAVTGSPLRAGAAADVLAGTGMPPDRLDFLATPPSGSAVTHRILLLTARPWPDVREDEWPATWEPPEQHGEQPWQQWGTFDEHQARAYAEPALNALAADLLPGADAVACRVTWSPAPPPGAPDTLRLSELSVSPLDVLYLAAASTLPRSATARPEDLAPELDRRILDALPRYPGVTPALDFDRSQHWPATLLSVGELLEVGRSAAQLLLQARPATAGELSDPAAPPAAVEEPDQLRQRARAAENRLDHALDLLDSPEATDKGLRAAAALAVDDTYPDPRWDQDQLLAAVDRARKELEKRKSRLANQDGPVAFIQTVFGVRAQGTKPFAVLPPFTPENLDRLRELATNSPSIQKDEQFDILCWLHGAAAVRRGTRSLAEVDSYREVLTGRAPPLAALQLLGPSDQWVALAGAGRISGLSVVVQTTNDEAAETLFAPPPPGSESGPSLAGVFVDEWTETIPATVETTGIAVRAETPGASAPQSILLAVTPPGSQSWTPRLLERTLLETLDLVHARPVDPDLLGAIGHFLPALAVTFNEAGETVSTDLFAT